METLINNKHRLILGDCVDILPTLNDEFFDLAIIDPPYWKVVGEKWDYLWRTEDDYIAWCRKWLSEVYDKLRIGGSCYLFGYFRILALLIPTIQDLGFDVRQQIVINKGIKSVAGRATKNYKMLPTTTESILFLVKDNKAFTKDFLLHHQKRLKLKSKEINDFLGVKSNGGGMWSIYTGKNVCAQFPTKELWDKLQNILQFSLEYEKIAQTFNPIMGLTDVWDDIDFYKEKRFHPTQKPLKLIDRLILLSSDEQDKVLDLFSGSGTTLISCEKNNRIATSIEFNEDCFKKIIVRAKS